MKEKWKKIAGYETYYRVSDIGNVMSIGRAKFNRVGKLEHRKPCLLKPRITASGYKQVTLCLKNKTKTFRVCRIVADAFCQGKSKLRNQVNHINAIKTDDRAINLEWVSQLENQHHAISLGLMNKRMRPILCIETNRPYKSISAASREIKGSPYGICHVLSGRQKHYKGLSFAYLHKERPVA